MIRLLRWLLGLCGHDDELIDTRTLPSPAMQEKEQAIEAGIGFTAERDYVPKWFYQTKLVTVVRCKKCGSFRHIRTTNPP